MSSGIVVTKRASNALIPLPNHGVVCWKVRDMFGNDYGTFKDRRNAVDFGGAVADRLGLDEIRFCRVVGPAADLAGEDPIRAEVSHG